MKHTPLVSFLAAASFLSACAAPNPARSGDPAPWKPRETKLEKSDPSRPADGPASGAQPSPASAPASEATPAGEPVVVRVGGKPVYVSELLSQWLYLDNFRVLDQIHSLARKRIVLAEAGRLRVQVGPDRAAQAYEEAVQALEKELAQSERGKRLKNLTLDKYVDRVLGLDPIRYREHVRDDALLALLGERVARTWLLQQEHARIQVIIVESEDALKAVQADLAAGKSFEDVARARSVDPSKEQGGAIAPVVRGPTPIAKAAFETAIGEVSSPLHDSGVWMILRVDSRPAPESGDWSAVGARVEASLAERPVDPLEVKQWQAAMLDRYEIDMKPFLELVNEPTR